MACLILIRDSHPVFSDAFGFLGVLSLFSPFKYTIIYAVTYIIKRQCKFDSSKGCTPGSLVVSSVRGQPLVGNILLDYSNEERELHL